MRPQILLLSALLASAGAWAQAPAAPAGATAAPLVQDSPPLEARKNQRIERIHLEDNGAVIDEVRYGGQTQSITVQPKANVPEYEIQTRDLARSRPADQRDELSGGAGKRLWNFFHF